VIRVIVADDHAVVREGLAGLLANYEDIDVVASVGDGTDAVEIAVAEHPDVVLMDLAMRECNGIEATRAITDAAPEVRVVILTAFSERDQILEAIDAGAVGYLLKDADPEELVRGIRAAVGGDAPFSPRATKALLSTLAARHPADVVTTRERQVLGLVAAGLANKAIASRLGISEKTVKAHLTAAFARIGVTDRVQAALWAERHGLTQP
jgi:DNA-binding NarL/FixJ family response regulator